METSEQLALRIEAHCTRLGISPSTFGQRHFKNSRLYSRLRKGGSITIDTYRVLIDILAAAESDQIPA